jgi:SPP1 gp7 family putative phage head morphogenesis protein
VKPGKLAFQQVQRGFVWRAELGGERYRITRHGRHGFALTHETTGGAPAGGLMGNTLAHYPTLAEAKAAAETHLKATAAPPQAPRRAAKPPPPRKAKDALSWFTAQIPFTREERDALEEKARRRAFFVSNVAQLRLVADVHKAITKAIAKGTTLQDFKKAVGKKLEREWGEERPAVVETIFRTNIQMAYNAGRLEQFDDPVVKRLRPYRGWAVILDARTTEFICRPLATVVVPADSAFAQSHNPPLHFRCRTGVMALSEEDAAAALGKGSHVLPELKVPPGFGGDPRDVVQAPADVMNEPAPLRRIMSHKLKREDSDESG